MGNSSSSISSTSSYDRCKSAALNRLAKDSVVSVTICAPISIYERSGNNNCYKTAMKTDQDKYSDNLSQCKINEINRQISAKGGISAGDNYTSSYPRTSTSDHHKTATISYIPLIKAIRNGNPIIKPPSGYLHTITIRFKHSHPIPNGSQFSGAYISNASPFYYVGQHNSLPTYIGKNGVRYWAKPDGVYQIGQGFTEGNIEKYNGIKQNIVYNTYKCKICGGFFDCTEW